MSRLNISDRALLVELYFKSDDSVSAAFSKYRSIKGIKSGTDPCTRRTLLNLVKKFRTTGNLADLPRVQQTNENASIIADYIEANPQCSVRRVSDELNIPKSTVHDTMAKKLNLHPYKPRIVQQLTLNARQRRLEFCSSFLAKLESGEIDLNDILWTDEASFYLSDVITVNNVYFWSDSNPNFTFEKPLKTAKVTVWAGFSGRFFLPPYFFEGNVTSDLYGELILKHVIPQLKRKRKFSATVYQQDGAPAHTSHHSMEILSHHFRNRLIAKNSNFCWPPYSPDLAPPDYFLWGYLKSKVYKNGQFHDLEELRSRISLEMSMIPMDIVKKVVNHFPDKLRVCIQRDGSHV